MTPRGSEQNSGHSDSGPRARLIQAAEATRRQVFTSLPWGLRLACVMFRVRFAADARSFGRFTYGLFHLFGVNGLPRAAHVPETIREIDKLPDGYGAEFGQKARRVVTKYLRDSDHIDEALSTVALKLIGNKSVENGVRGKDLHQAENYVLKMVQNQALDVVRSERVRRHEDITELLREPGSWESIGELIPQREQEQIRRELEESVSPRLAPDLVAYLDLLLEGVSNKSIAEQKMLPSLRERPMSQQGLAKYRDRIKQVLQRHFEVQATCRGV